MRTHATERLRYLANEVAESARGKSPAELAALAMHAVAARWYLRRCTRVGMYTRVYGRPRVVNKGILIIGEHVMISSTIATTELAVSPGGRLEIGDRASINYGSSIGATGLVRIGSRCMLGTHVMILDNDFHEIEQRDKVPLPRPVVLEDNVWLANRSLVLPGVTIGHDSVIGAGSVVMTDIPPRCVALGNPARVIRTF